MDPLCAPVVWTSAFLSVLASHGVISEAARTCGVSVSTVTAKRRIDGGFDLACHEALEVYRGRLEIQIRERAESSDTVLLALARAELPDKYDRKAPSVNVSVNSIELDVESLVARVFGDSSKGIATNANPLTSLPIDASVNGPGAEPLTQCARGMGQLGVGVEAGATPQQAATQILES